MPHLKNISFNALFMKKNEKISKRSFLKIFSLPEFRSTDTYSTSQMKTDLSGSGSATPCLGVCKENRREVQDMSSLHSTFFYELAGLQYTISSLLDCCVHKGN
jgi:hypothetical protein